MATVPRIGPTYIRECVYQLFEHRAAADPDRVAIVADGMQLTYGELNSRANQVAHMLGSLGAVPDITVGLCLTRSLNQLIALLGVMKSGAAYLPIDPAHPHDRVAYMLHDTGTSLVLTESSLEARFPVGTRRLRIDADWRRISEFPVTNPERRISPDHLAYCIFTSGSTGTPKAVAVPHRGLTNHALNMTRILDIRPNDRVLQFTSIAFDAALEEILPAWLGGATLVLMPKHLPASAAFVDFLSERKVSVVSLPPSYWHQWVDDLSRLESASLPALRLVFVGGEKVSAEKLSRWQALPFSAGLEWIVDYGPTEATISCTTFRLGDAPWGKQVPIGRALSGLTVTVLDDQLRPTPIDQTGEIYVGGAGVARGYWGRPGMTAERFLPDPVGAPGARMYRTGDMGRLRADGQLEFAGRADDQIKIRGHRIEPGEIEGVLLRQDGVRDVVVLPRDRGKRGLRLVAYVVADGLAEPGLRAALASKLPEVMMPDAFVFLPALPLSPITGKIDRSRLPEPTIVNVPAMVEASNLQLALAAVWADIVGRAPASLDQGFVACGGDSLAWIRLMTRLHELVRLPLDATSLSATATVRGLSELMLKTFGVGAHGEALSVLGDDLAQALSRTPAEVVVEVSDADDHCGPASNTQRRLWFLHRAEPNDASYVVPLAYRLQGEVDVHRLDIALSTVVARHAVLRTGFVERDGQLIQQVAKPGPLAFTALSARDLDTALKVASEHAAQPMLLDEPPLIKGLRIVLGERDTLLVFLLHHAICDAWSLALLCREFAQLYEGCAAGAEALPAPVQFIQCVHEQRRWLASPDAGVERAFWRDYLQGERPKLQLGGFSHRTELGSRKGAMLPLVLTGSLRDEVISLAKRAGCTEFVVLLAAFLACLHRTALQDDIVIGIPVACRLSRRAEQALGPFVNTLALRSVLEPGQRFDAFVRQTARQVGITLARQALPFDEIVDAVGLPRTVVENSLFSVMFVMQSTPADGGLPLSGVRSQEVRVHNGTTKFDLVCSVRSTPDGLEGEIEYNCAALTAAGGERFADSFVQLLSHGARAPGECVAALGMLCETDAVARGNAPNLRVEHFNDLTTIHHRIEAQVRRTPNAIAAEIGGSSMTYAELDERANRLAGLLVATGVGPDHFIGVCIDRSLDLMVALFGVLKSGAAFIPLDSSFPPERVSRIFADAEPTLLLTHAPHGDRFGRMGVRTIDINAALDVRNDGGTARWRAPAGHPQQAAYVYYTSGSTGAPKGVVIEHGCALSRLEWLHRRYAFVAGNRVLQKTPLIFDVAIWEIFGPLMTGATVSMAEPGMESDVNHIGSLLARPGCVFAHFVPSMLDAYLRAAPWRTYPDLRWVQLSGEAVPRDLPARFTRHFDCELHNMYGQTETSEVAAYERAREDTVDFTAGFVPMGRQIGIYRLFVLDSALNPVPTGVPGELCVAGVGGIARGYHRQPLLTAERFVPHPFPIVPGERLYRTGDLVRELEDGALEYLGRLDQQTKIRGCRVETGEVEAALRRHPSVRACAVVARPDETGSNRLVAYLVGDAFELNALATHIEAILPRYMIPEAYIFLEQLPFTVSGKLDRNRLPPPDPEYFEARVTSEELPRPGLEEQLASIWCEVLGIRKVGRNDNFFVVGGNSLKSVQVLSRIRKRYEIEVSVRQFFAAPTIKELAAVVLDLLERWVQSLSDTDVAERLERNRA